jgi:3-methyladenine DNA glycosylase/8-oxoguanine DNA glycosylase
VSTSPDAVIVWQPGRALDVRGTLAPLRRGAGDPAHRPAPDGAIWRTTLAPTGAATLRITTDRAGGEVRAEAWGPGADWAVGGVPDLLGARDDDSGYDDVLTPPLREVRRRHGGLRVGRTGRVLEALVPAVLEQKVTGTEAHRSWRELLWRFGAPAPGPAPTGMRVIPSARQVAAIPSWEWHRAGVGPQRSATAVRVSQVAGRLEECVDLPVPEAHRRLQLIPGVGPWTSAEVAQRALGDADAVSVGDFNLPKLVGFALAGERGTDDARMLELLEPFRPHRYRVVRLLELAGPRPERRGPRFAPRDYRSM